MVLLVLGQRGDDRLLGRPAVPGSAGRQGWTGEAGLWSTLVHSALLYSTLGGSLAEEVALRHLDDLLALVRDPHLVTTGLGLGSGLGQGQGWGQGQGHGLLTVIGLSLVCVAVTSADGKTFLTKRVAASRSWCPPSL